MLVEKKAGKSGSCEIFEIKFRFHCLPSLMPGSEPSEKQEKMEMNISVRAQADHNDAPRTAFVPLPVSSAFFRSSIRHSNRAASTSGPKSRGTFSVWIL